jgi:hypothetical protein
MREQLEELDGQGDHGGRHHWMGSNPGAEGKEETKIFFKSYIRFPYRYPCQQTRVE